MTKFLVRLTFKYIKTKQTLDKIYKEQSDDSGE